MDWCGEWAGCERMQSWCSRAGRRGFGLPLRVFTACRRRVSTLANQRWAEPQALQKELSCLLCRVRFGAKDCLKKWAGAFRDVCFSFGGECLNLISVPAIRLANEALGWTYYGAYYPAFLPFCFFCSSIFPHFLFSPNFQSLFCCLKTHTQMHILLRQLCLTLCSSAPAPSCRFSVLLNLDSFRPVPNTEKKKRTRKKERPGAAAKLLNRLFWQQQQHPDRSLLLTLEMSYCSSFPPGGIPGDWCTTGSLQLTPVVWGDKVVPPVSKSCMPGWGDICATGLSWESGYKLSTRELQLSPHWRYWCWA